ncbi:DUF4349 domain-containing protein [Winogradskyella psychrotolerans]|uniref:DUF4349 domain-containing protein n=1 Tax=Winogradskyella psychrotolerans TaxID=1344585 RepID=UPI001C07E1C0|nr:DUF4349 domain-containing protein [Winogradskyella psychrotolerans]MBU2928805.1 DUF4349 domain-containing protein [Winogradskyella psychrotolerans]
MKRKSLKTTLILCAIAILLVACQQSESSENFALKSVDVETDFEAIKTDDVEFESKSKPQLKNLKIIKSANVRYKVKNVKIATERVKRISQAYNSYISDLRFENNLYKKENRFTLKVPSKDFDIIMDSISSVAEFIAYENITTKDVTSEFIDVTARLKTKLEVKERYENILRSKANSVEDLLDVEEKLQRIQEEIESSQGQIKYLTNKVAFSTIQIDLYETVEYKEEPEHYKKTFIAEIKEGFTSGWDVLKLVFIGLVYIWPFIVIGMVAFILIRKRVKK